MSEPDRRALAAVSAIDPIADPLPDAAGQAGWGRSLAALAGTRVFLQAVTFVAAALAAGGLIMWLTLAWTSDVISRQVVETLSVEADGVVAVGQSAGPAAAIEIVTRKSRAARAELYLLVSSGGTKLAGNLDRWPDEMPWPARLVPPLLPDGAGATLTGATFEYISSGRGPARLAAGISRSVGADMALIVGRDLETQRMLAQDIRWLYLAGFGALAIAGLAAGLLSSRLAVSRVGEIARTSDEIMAGDMSRRVPITGTGDELDRLAGNLNAMLDRIESLMAGLREVSDNIAHDLKTPLTRLRSRAEDALREGNAARSREGLGRVIEDADELIKTFNALLLIARLEAGALEGTKETFDVAGLVRDVAELYEPVAEEAGMMLTCLADDSVSIHANRQLVGQAIANLVDNAIKYGQRNAGAVRTEKADGEKTGPDIGVVLTASEKEVRIAVADRGPGIPAEDRERVLKRFVRLEASRTRPGTGLGLSLVAAVARLHGGRILLEDNQPGLRIVLVLPRKRMPGHEGGNEA